MSEEEVSIYEDTSKIYALELLAPALALYELRGILQNKSVIFFIDNNAASGALIRGASSNSVIDKYVALFWKIANQFNITVWVERVASKSNIADHPTRDNPLPIPHRGKRVFWSFEEWNVRAQEVFN